MSYIEKTLVPGERVVYTTRLHWVVMMGHLILALVLAALGAFLLIYAYRHQPIQPDTMHILDGGGIAALAAGLVALIMGSVRRNATEMAVTTRRVVIKTGLASRRTIETLLNKVETIEISEPAMGRMLGYGSIVVVGTGGTSEPFTRMAHPLEFRSRVLDQIENLRVAPGPVAGTRENPPQSV